MIEYLAYFVSRCDTVQSKKLSFIKLCFIDFLKPIQKLRDRKIGIISPPVAIDFVMKIAAYVVSGWIVTEENYLWQEPTRK